MYGNDDAWFMKVDANGDSIHSAVFGGSADDDLVDLIEIDHTTMVFLFYSNSSDHDFSGGIGSYDAWIKSYNFSLGLSPGARFGWSSVDIPQKISKKNAGGY